MNKLNDVLRGIAFGFGAGFGYAAFQLALFFIMT